MSASNPRALKLKKQFDALINGKQPLTKQNYLLFIEALCSEPNVAACVSKVVGSPKGLDCIQSSMRIDLSPAFLNGFATDVLKYLSAPELADIGGGVYLQRVILSIVEPPIFWDTFRMAFQAGQLQQKAECCFAWLLLKLVSLPGDQSTTYLEIADDPTITDALISSAADDARSFAHKIKHILATRGTGVVVDLEYGPGGRHDNDFTDFRQITILPTADELMSKEPPFLRPSDALDVVETEAERVATHLDNQFRLMREDMLYEMRDELQMSEGKIAVKKAKRRGFIMDGLRLLDVHYEFTDGKKCKWGLTFQCPADFWQFKGVKPKDRKDYAQKNPKIFRHQSMTCLLVDDGVVAFPSVNRDLDLLAKVPPIIVLQVEGHKTATNTLLKLRMANRIKLIQIDTAVFSYDPILTALQEKQDLSLSPELLSWTKESSLNRPADQPWQIVDAIKANPGQNLQHFLKTLRPIHLDKAQADSLLAGLTQRVSLIQGPPGTFVFFRSLPSQPQLGVAKARESRSLALCWPRPFTTSPHRRSWLFATPTTLSTSFLKIFSTPASQNPASFDWGVSLPRVPPTSPSSSSRRMPDRSGAKVTGANSIPFEPKPTCTPMLSFAISLNIKLRTLVLTRS